MELFWLYLNNWAIVGLIALYSIIFSGLPITILNDPDNRALAAPTESLSYNPIEMTIRIVFPNLCPSSS